MQILCKLYDSLAFLKNNILYIQIGEYLNFEILGHSALLEFKSSNSFSESLCLRRTFKKY